MARHRIKKYSRRRSASPYKSRVAPIVISVIAFILLSLTVSVVVGIMLGKRADAIGEREKKFDFERVDYDSNGKTVSTIEAYHFPSTSRPQDYVNQDIRDLSVCVRHRDGVLDYSFDITDKLFPSESGARSFKSLCSDADSAGARVCAYLYVTAFDIEDEYEREIVAAYEIALINEIASSGADDILLLGLNATAENIGEIERFVARAAGSTGDVPLGVAVSEETLALSENGEYVAARLRASCDYLALDLTHLTVADGESGGKDGEGEEIPSRLEEILQKNAYYIKSYPMRVLFAREESKLYIPAIALGVTDLQIIIE